LNTVRSRVVFPKQTLQFVSDFHAGAVQRQEEAAAVEPETSILDTIKEPMIAGPLLGLLSLGAIGNGAFHFDEETQLLGLFALFCGTIGTQFGASIGAGIDADTKELLDELNEQEDAMIENMELAIGHMQSFVDSNEHLKEVFEAQKSLLADTLDAKTAEVKFMTHSSILQLLNQTVAQEERQRSALKANLMEAATASVTQSCASKAMRTASVAEALKIVAGKEGKDVVGEAYMKYFDAESARMSKEADKSVVDAPTDKAAVFAEVKDLASNFVQGFQGGDKLVTNSEKLSKLVKSYKSVAQTVGEEAALMAGPQ
jgi:hypothetical protein